jgi:hypothetical protein
MGRTDGISGRIDKGKMSSVYDSVLSGGSNSVFSIIF